MCGWPEKTAKDTNWRKAIPARWIATPRAQKERARESAHLPTASQTVARRGLACPAHCTGIIAVVGRNLQQDYGTYLIFFARRKQKKGPWKIQGPL